MFPACQHVFNAVLCNASFFSFLVWEGIECNSKERKIIYSLVPKAVQQVNVSIFTVRAKGEISIAVMTLVCNVSIKPQVH